MHIFTDKANNVDKAQSLWLQMQEENIHPTDHFLYTLSELLKRNDKPVPFSAPLREPEGNLEFIKFRANDYVS